MKRLPHSDSESPATMATYKRLFVDTSLETHFLILVSNSDMVSDIKEKLSLEHLKNYPQFGEVKINSLSLKVHPDGHSYILSDSMPIYHAFSGVKGNCFLSADVSRTQASETDVRVTANVNMILPTSNISHSEMASGLKDEKSLKRAVDFQSNHNSTEICTETNSPAKKKCKLTHNDDAYHNSSVEPEVSGFRNGIVVHQVNEASEALLECKQQGEHIMSSKTIAEVLDRSDYDSNLTFEGMLIKAAAKTSVVGGVNSDLIASDDTKKNDPTRCPETVTLKDSNLSDKVNDNIGSVEDAKSHGNSIKKNKVKKVATKVQDSSYMEHKTKKVISINRTVVPAAEEHPLLSDQGKEDTILESVDLDISKAGKSETEHCQDIVESMTVKESHLSGSAKLLDTSDTMDVAKSELIKLKKKKSKKKVAKVQDLSSMGNEIKKGKAKQMKEEDQLSPDQDRDIMLPPFKRPLLSNSTELSNSLKFNDLGSKTDSRGKSATGRRDSALNLAAVSNSTSKSLSVFGNGLKDKTLSRNVSKDMRANGLEDNTLCGNGSKDKRANGLEDKKLSGIGSKDKRANGLEDKTLSGNGSKDKRAVANSSSKQATTIVNNKGDINLQSDINANNKMAMKNTQSKNLLKRPRLIFKDNSYKSSGTPKTPHKKSLLTTEGSIFDVSSSDNDSGNKVATVYSDATTSSSSDSSSQSSHSEGESATSQNPTRNELIDKEHGSTPPKLDLSASKDVTMEMILRSSKYYKKALKHIPSSPSELIATQTEP